MSKQRTGGFRKANVVKSMQLLNNDHSLLELKQI